MTYHVLITKEPDKRYTGRVLLLPEIVASGASEKEVLELIRTAVGDVRKRSHVVRLDIASEPSPVDEDAWMRFAGIWAGDPDWQTFQEEVASFRRSCDAEECST